MASYWSKQDLPKEYISPHNKENTSPSKKDVPKAAVADLIEGNASLLSTGDGSDLTITINGAEFKVHKAILASRSPFFATTCWGHFMEAHSNRLDLSDDDPELVKKMIDYFYLLDYESDKDRDLNCASPADADLAIDGITNLGTRHKIAGLQQEVPHVGVRKCYQALAQNDFDYEAALLSLAKPPFYYEPVIYDPESADNSGNDTAAPQLAIHASMYGIADKYDVQGLKTVSMERMRDALQSKGWNSIYQQSYTPAMMEELATAIQATWTSTPSSDDGIRALLLEYSLKNKDVLTELEQFKLVFQDTPQFACDLVAWAPRAKKAEPVWTRSLEELPAMDDQPAEGRRRYLYHPTGHNEGWDDTPAENSRRFLDQPTGSNEGWEENPAETRKKYLYHPTGKNEGWD